MAESVQAFCLRLNNHKNFMSEALFRLYRDQTFVDCTLAAEGRQLRAHRLVLAAFSPYFKDIFAQCPANQYPVVVIKNMPFRDLKAVIEYIYRGEVNVSRHRIRAILENGIDLQVKGLAEFDANKWITDLDDSETCAAERRTDSADYGSDNGSIDKNYSKGLTNNSVNGCESESSENINNNKKQTRKTRHKLYAANGCADRAPGKCVQRVRPSVSAKTNDTNSATNDHKTNDDNRFASEYLNEKSIKILNRSENVDTNSDELTETSLGSMGSPLINAKVLEHYLANAMTGKSKPKHRCRQLYGIDAIAALEQSVLICVKPDVNRASQPSEASSSGHTSDGRTAANASQPIAMTDNNTNVMSDQTQCDSDLRRTDKNISANKGNKNDVFNDIRAQEVIDDISATKRLIATNMRNESQSLRSVTVEEQKQQIERNTSKTSKLLKVESGRKQRSPAVQMCHKRFHCPDIRCHKVYASLQNMKEHLRNTHTNPDQKYKCAICLKEYSWRHALDRHFKSKHSAR